jgi:hypothetical protein
MGNIKNNIWIRHLKALVFLVVLQYLIDLVFVYIYPTVNPLRASLIGITAFTVLWIPWLRKQISLHPRLAFLPIFVNAFIGALSVQGGIVISKSTGSAVLHVGILIVTYIIITSGENKS